MIRPSTACLLWKSTVCAAWPRQTTDCSIKEIAELMSTVASPERRVSDRLPHNLPRGPSANLIRLLIV